MWANDVGRYSAANYDTLRTVFEINLKLFHTAQYASSPLLSFLCLLAYPAKFSLTALPLCRQDLAERDSDLWVLIV